MPIKPPVELSRPTILNIAAIICYCLAILFHIIAFATDNWSSLTLGGIRYKVGLWQGCRMNETTNEWQCSADVFEDEAFKTGSDWHIGTRIMMVFSLILLFVLEFAIIAYACIKRLERYKSRLVAIILGLSATSGLATLSCLIIFGEGGPKGRFEWSFGVALLSLVFQVICLIIVVFDRYRTNLAGKAMRKSRECVSSETYTNYDDIGYTNTVVDGIGDQMF